MASKAKSFIGTDMTAVTPYLYIEGAAEAVAFYDKILGATVRFKMEGKDGAVMHAEMMVNGALFMMGECNPDMQMPSPKQVGGTASGIFVYVPDADSTFKAAIAAGATQVRPLEDMFWGDRTGCFIDPFGHAWTVATHVEDLSEAETQERADKWMKENVG